MALALRCTACRSLTVTWSLVSFPHPCDADLISTLCHSLPSSEPPALSLGSQHLGRPWDAGLLPLGVRSGPASPLAWGPQGHFLAMCLGDVQPLNSCVLPECDELSGGQTRCQMDGFTHSAGTEVGSQWEVPAPRPLRPSNGTQGWCWPPSEPGQEQRCLGFPTTLASGGSGPLLAPECSPA